jgi:hypothetical protein
MDVALNDPNQLPVLLIAHGWTGADYEFGRLQLHERVDFDTLPLPPCGFL